MKKTIVVLITLLSTTFVTNNFAYASRQKQNQLFFANNNNFPQHLTAKQSQILLAESSQFIALAQKVDRETGLAAEEWNQFYKVMPQGRLSIKETLTRLNYLIEASQRISQHHKNASQIAKQMYPLSPRAYEEQTFVKTLINFNAQAGQKFLKFQGIFSKLKSDLEANDSAAYLNDYQREFQGVVNYLMKTGAEDVRTIKQFVVFRGYRYYPYLGGDPQAAAEVAAMLRGQANALRQAGDGLACVGAANCELVPSR